jgi:small conductance mechanosensitive channel
MAILNETSMRLLITFLILIAGFLVSRYGGSLIIALSKKKETINVRQIRFVKMYKYLVMIFTIAVSLLYLKKDVLSDILLVGNLFTATYEFLPNVLLFTLLFVLGIAIVNMITFAIKRFFDTIGLTDLMLEQNKDHMLNGIMYIVRISLYILVLTLVLNVFGINIKGITVAISWLFYGILALLFLYIFFGTRGFVENFIAGIYIKSSSTFKLGQKVKIDDIEGSIKSISNQGVTIKTDFGYNAFIPNRDFVKKEISFRNIETDLDTLEKIKSYFVEQKPSFCGPASASMILKIFGYNESQAKIGDLSKTEVGMGTHPNTLIKVVQDITKNKVKGSWIDVEHITDLKNELRLWLSQGALTIVDYKKKILFPESKAAHYSVVVAIEGDDLVVLDPSGKKGGVYLAESDKIYRGMDTYSELIKGKRGYIVFAPEGTTAYHRIEEGLIYADPSLYKDLSNKLKKELFNFLEKGQALETVLPMRVKNFIRKWKEKDRIARLWKPESI